MLRKIIICFAGSFFKWAKILTSYLIVCSEKDIPRPWKAVNEKAHFPIVIYTQVNLALSVMCFKMYKKNLQNNRLFLSKKASAVCSEKLLTKKPIFQLWFCTLANLALSARWPAMCFKRWKVWSRRSWWSSSALMLLPMTSLGPLRPWLCPRCFTFIQVVAHHQSQRLLRILQPPPLQPSVFESSLELSL